MEHSSSISINEKNRITVDSVWWKPLSMITFSKERNVTRAELEKKSQTSWSLGLQINRTSEQIVFVRHNYWFYYYTMTALLASIYIFILLVNLFLLIPYSLISGFFILVSVVAFFATFIGLICFMVYIDGVTEAIVSTRPLSEGMAILFIGVPMAIFLLGIAILAQYEQRPLVMVGAMLFGIDLLIYCCIYAFSYNQNAVHDVDTKLK